MFSLAEHLHKSIGEVEDMPESDLAEWLAYFRIKAEERKDR